MAFVEQTVFQGPMPMNSWGLWSFGSSGFGCFYVKAETQYVIHFSKNTDISINTEQTLEKYPDSFGDDGVYAKNLKFKDPYTIFVIFKNSGCIRMLNIIGPSKGSILRISELLEVPDPPIIPKISDNLTGQLHQLSEGVNHYNGDSGLMNIADMIAKTGETRVATDDLFHDLTLLADNVRNFTRSSDKLTIADMITKLFSTTKVEKPAGATTILDWNNPDRNTEISNCGFAFSKSLSKWRPIKLTITVDNPMNWDNTATITVGRKSLKITCPKRKSISVTMMITDVDDSPTGILFSGGRLWTRKVTVVAIAE